MRTVDKHTFFWVIGAIFAVMLAIVSFQIGWMVQMNNEINDMRVSQSVLVERSVRALHMLEAMDDELGIVHHKVAGMTP